MVLESIIKSRFVLKHPFAMLFFAITITTVSIGISLATFHEYASILTIAFITIGGMPVLFKIFAREEQTEAQHPQNPATFLGRHFHIIQIYAFFFLGVLLAYAFWYAALPPTFQSEIFQEQEKNWIQINGLRGNVSGNFLDKCQSGNLIELAFSCIFANNAIVLAWALILSFFYGAGSIFLIAWNASVVGLVIGKEAVAGGVTAGLFRAVGLVPHGLLEIIAYFIGSIAGGIISVAIAKKTYLKKEFETIGMDVIVMVIIAYALLVAAALIEAFFLL